MCTNVSTASQPNPPNYNYHQCCVGCKIIANFLFLTEENYEARRRAICQRYPHVAYGVGISVDGGGGSGGGGDGSGGGGGGSGGGGDGMERGFDLELPSWKA